MNSVDNLSETLRVEMEMLRNTIHMTRCECAQIGPNVKKRTLLGYVGSTNV